VITAPWVWKSEAPAAEKIPEICAPECPPTVRVSADPRWTPTSSWIRKVTWTGASPGLKTPAFVRNPGKEPPFWIEVRTVRLCAAEPWSPGTNIPTVGWGAVE
jgi:hypothetical protein